MSNDPFERPGSASGISWDDLKGSLLIIDVHGIEHVNSTFGESDPVRADVRVVDGDKAGAEYMDTLVFPKVLITQLKSKIGSKVIGRLGQGEAKSGQSPPWILLDATDADVQAGVEFLNRNTFTQPAQSTSTQNAQPPF